MNNYSKNRINLLEEYIRNSSEKTTPDLVNANSFYSYRHANRLFKSLKGESINTFSNKIRLQLAADYLKYTSESITTIALEIEYKSRVAFSKAFKKQYGLTPSDFRNKNNVTQLFKNTGQPHYRVEYFDEHEISMFKVPITASFTFERFYKNTKKEFGKLNIKSNQWMLLWDEDPELSKVSESRFFIGINSNELSKEKEPYKTVTLKGKYAVFEADSLKEFGYDAWAELAYLVLNTKGIKLREDIYLEWFYSTSLNSQTTFFPYKIAIPIL